MGAQKLPPQATGANIRSAIDEHADELDALNAGGGAGGLTLGTTSTTAARGDQGLVAYNHSQITTGNPHGTTKADIGLSAVSNTAPADLPISTAQAAVNSVKADLVSGKVPASQLPSYVDDVLEVANFAALPNPGETGKIYITDDTNLQYRWSGSAYVQLVPSPGSTDAVPEGTTNKYFTIARVLGTTLVGYAAGTGNVAITAADSILNSIQKLSGSLVDIYSKISANTTKLANVTASYPRNELGILIPVFRTANKFDYLGAALPANQLTVATGGGLVSPVSGTVADGYLRIQTEVEARNSTRMDYLVSWDTTESGASHSYGYPGYLTTIANSGGNVVVTFPSGATKSSPLTGIVTFCFSFTTGNYGITSSAHLILDPTNTSAYALASTNVFRVPVFEFAKVTKPGLTSAYFNTNTTSSKIVGFLHNGKGWGGDPTGQLLTRTAILNGAGYPGDHDSMIIIPERANPGNLLKVVHFMHGRTLVCTSIFDITIADSGDTGRQLLSAGYAIIATSGGVGNTTIETDGWGNGTWISRAEEVYKAISENVSNIGKEYIFEWSMGGASGFSYMRANPARIGARWACCPALDFEETGVRSLQGDATLNASLNKAHSYWQFPLVAGTTDPNTDQTNWRRCSGAGMLPPIGMTNYTVTTVATATTANATVPLTSAARIQPGDSIYFKNAGVSGVVQFMASGVPNSVTLNIPVTVGAGDSVSIIRQDGKQSQNYQWASVRPADIMTVGSTSTIGNFYRRVGPNPLADVKPNNPSRFTDLHAAAGVPMIIDCGGDGTSTGNDGILNNGQMYAYAAAVNAAWTAMGKSGTLVTVIAGSGGHISAGNLNAASTIALFNGN